MAPSECFLRTRASEDPPLPSRSWADQNMKMTKLSQEMSRDVKRCQEMSRVKSLASRLDRFLNIHGLPPSFLSTLSRSRGTKTGTRKVQEDVANSHYC